MILLTCAAMACMAAMMMFGQTGEAPRATCAAKKNG